MARSRKKPSPPQDEKQDSNLDMDFFHFARAMGKQVIDPMWANSILKDFNGRPQKFKVDDIIRWMENPSSSERELRELHHYLQNISPHYKRVVSYLASILTFDYIIVPICLDEAETKSSSYLRNYQKVLEFYEKFNIKDEFQKIMHVVVAEDVGYYYLRENEDGITLQRMPSNFCKLVNRNQFGFQYAFDFAYFDKQGVNIEDYPPEFKSLYTQSQKASSRWLMLDPMKSVAFKFDENNGVIIPPLVGIFMDAIEIQEYKELIKNKSMLENWKILIQKIPMKTDKDATKNQFLIDLGKAQTFHDNVKANLPTGVAVVTTPMDVDAINFEKADTKDNIIGYAEQSFFRSAGVSQLLFNSEQGGSIGLTQSIKADEAFVIHMYRQFERWINFIVSQRTVKYRFRTIFPDITFYNRTEKMDEFLKMGQFGMPKSLLACSAGLSPVELFGLTYFENAMNLTDIMRPLQSASTVPTDEGGRPLSKDDKLGDKGVEQRDNQDNKNRSK